MAINSLNNDINSDKSGSSSYHIENKLICTHGCCGKFLKVQEVCNDQEPMQEETKSRL